MPTALRKTQAPPSIGERIRQYNEQNRRQLEQLQALMPDGLSAFVADAFEGENVYVNVGAARSAEDACAQVIAAIEPHFEKKLNDKQLADIGAAVVMRWNARLAQRKAEWADTAARLANPFFSLGAR